MRLAELEHFLLARNDRATSKRLRLTFRLIQHTRCALFGGDKRPLLLGGIHLTPRLSSEHVRDDRRDKPKGANKRRCGNLAHEDLCSTAATRGFLIVIPANLFVRTERATVTMRRGRRRGSDLRCRGTGARACH